jgi:c-di-GMP-related signal transduction protein
VQAATLTMGKIFDAWQAAFKERNLDAMFELMSDDFIFEMHSSGKKMDKAGFRIMMENFVKANIGDATKQRCVYENEEIIVSHAFNKFPNGSVDAILTVRKVKDGKVCFMETGSTSIAVDSPNYY